MDAQEFTQGVRVMLRDYPQYFEVDMGPVNTLTSRLPHPLIDAASLQVYLYAPPDPDLTLTTDWTLDARNGILKYAAAAVGQSTIVAGYYFSWFSNEDLGFHSRQVVAEHLHGRSLTEQQLTPVEIEVIQIGTVVHALWSLALELSLDIDVSTPEGMFIPARQRYAQVLQMMQYWEGQYSQKSADLNVGLGALDVYRLRRVARLTNRYVPIYQEREFDDPNPPERLYPPIPSGVPPHTVASEVTTLEMVDEVFR